MSSVAYVVNAVVVDQASLACSCDQFGNRLLPAVVDPESANELAMTMYEKMAKWLDWYAPAEVSSMFALLYQIHEYAAIGLVTGGLVREFDNGDIQEAIADAECIELE